MGRSRLKHGRDYVAIGIQYARDVVSGTIPACQWVRAACQRHLDDLENPGKWIFDADRASKICRFAEMLPHVKGRWSSPTFILEPWQCFILTAIFGWIDADGMRRFRKALIVLPRKNGKSALASIVGLYGLALDKEPGAEVYAAATTRDQAKVVWDVSRRMAQRTPRFCEAFGVTPLAHSITVEQTGSCFKPLSRDADSLEGLNPHFAIVDELHAHSVREVFDVLDEATGARRQPLMFIISTEGDNPTGVFAEQVAYAQQILEGRHSDDSYFAAIYTIDPEDDWTSPAAWRKANPNLGVSVFESDLEIRCRQAEKNPASQSSFLTKRLNVRVGASLAYFNMLAWKQLCYDSTLQLEDYYGKPCTIGLDLASKRDIAAKVMLFRDGAVFLQSYLPELCMERGNPNYDVYRGWAEQGFLTLTPGDETDFEFIERDVREDCHKFSVSSVAYDEHQARYLSQRLRFEGISMHLVPQQVKIMNEAMQDVGACILAGKMKHDGNPMLAWMIGNVVAKMDAKENVYPRKTRDENKIDGAVALMMARASERMAQPIRSSIYNDPMTCAV